MKFDFETQNASKGHSGWFATSICSFTGAVPDSRDAIF